MWLARDKNGDLLIYNTRPDKVEHYDGRGWWQSPRLSQCRISEDCLPQGVNPQWEDEEPIEVKLKIEKI